MAAKQKPPRKKTSSHDEPFVAIKPGTTPPTLTIAETAHFTRRSASTIRRLIANKRLRASKFSGKFMITVADINAMAARRANTEDA